MVKSFEDLKVYQDSMTFLAEVHDLLKRDVIRTDFVLSNQMKRAVLSISNNIAEGFERETYKELVRFLYIAKGSAGEVRNIINVLKRINYIDDKEYEELREKIINISKQLSNFIKYIIKKNQGPKS